MGIVSGKCVALHVVADIPVGMNEQEARIWLAAQVSHSCAFQPAGTLVEVQNKSGAEYAGEILKRIQQQESGMPRLVT